MRASAPTLATLFAAAVTACASGRGPEIEPSPDAGSTAELEALYRARTDSARLRFSDADVHFMTGMIGHHGQALVMAAMAPTHGASPSIQTLAARIINAQNDEIATMQRWLRDRGRPVPEVEVVGTTLRVNGSEYTMRMPGMLTPEQIRELDAARGPEFDRLFLTSMIQHHEGAVTMVVDLFATDGALRDEAAFRLASDIQVDQRTEIARMRLMLESLPESDAG
ncbi:MAG: DUF305 domain-containing protein, partial [Gemmatimonadales bacterium]